MCIDLVHYSCQYTLVVVDGKLGATGRGWCLPVSRLLIRTNFWSAVRLPRAAGISPDDDHGADKR